MSGKDDIAQAIQDHEKRIKWDDNDVVDQPTTEPNNPRYDEVVLSTNSHSVNNNSGKRQQHNFHHSSHEHGGAIIDPTVCHIKRGIVVMPIEMTITDDDTSTPPSYTIKSSNMAVYAAFPPPPPCTATTTTTACYPIDDEEFEMIQVKKRLQQYSGFHGAIGTTTATLFGQGYADTILSLNYRFPTLVSLPMPQHHRQRCCAMIGNLHSNLHFGSTSHLLLGGSLSSLDGKTNLRLDTSNPFFDENFIDDNKEQGIFQLRPQQKDYTVSLSRDFVTSSASSNPIRVQFMTNIRPSSRGGQERFHFGYCNVMVTSSLDTTTNNKDTKSRNNDDVVTSKSKISLCAGYGAPSPGGEALWMSQLLSSSDVHSRDCGINMYKTDLITSGGARIALDLEQPLSQSQSCQSTIEYHHAGQALSLGTLFTRTFASSKLASVGVGIRHTFGNIFHNTGNQWWSKGVTSWMFQMQRGETRIVVPIKIYPIEVTTWNSVLRLCYASLATIVVDTLVAELLCDEISKLRLKFLKFVLGEESVKQSYSLLAGRQDERKAQQNESRLHQLQDISKARDEALRQCDLMKRQARNAMKKEEEQDGLVILNAMYGVLDNETGKWIETTDKDASQMHIMDATTQLQFWTESSALHISSVSKQHCLGFYDVLACVSEEDWRKPEIDSKDVSNPSLLRRLRNILGLSNSKDNSRRDLVAALRVRYKWAGQEFVKIFHDEDVVDLP